MRLHADGSYDASLGFPFVKIMLVSVGGFSDKVRDLPQIDLFLGTVTYSSTISWNFSSPETVPTFLDKIQKWHDY